MSDLESEIEESDYDSETELQEAFKKGLLKPGLNTVSVKEERKFKNNVTELKEKLTEMKLKLPWVERLDLVTGQAPLAPELAFKLEEQERRRENQLKNVKKGQPKVDISDDPVLNDFRREMTFHRQAQAAVLEGVARLKALGIPTKRPDDYFAQMAKSDEHMQKVREELLKRQLAQQRSEKVRQMREQRKMNKQLQIQSKLKRASEKRELMEQVKKFRQKKRTDLDFLDDKKKLQQRGPGGKKGAQLNKKAQLKRNYKEKKFGFGGKKRGLKSNTKASTSDVSEYRRPKKEHFQKNKMKQRPGKNKRIKQKAKRRK
ncbi:probable rRNA-processing protein EBP2 homolog [Anabrus simplex]|uniref:probable rRNA-processing protein EBP2 homolog n=1 Tax=Anabrus simplex TaxID=316456 RepID=UPI0034DDBB22